MLSALSLALLAGSAAGYPRTPALFSRQAFSAPGVATFNDYAAQGQTVCGPLSGTGNTYGAAASDISPDVSGGMCSAPSDHDMGLCSGNQAQSGYQGPACPKGNCGTCYKVTNQGGYGGSSIGGVGNSVIVQIIDSCPSGSAQNYCKTDVPADERCGDSGTNALDIDQAAYQALTGTPFGSGPNLQISIEPSDCSGGNSDGGSVTIDGTTPDAATVTTPPTSSTAPEAAASSTPDNNNPPGPAPASPTSTPPAASTDTPSSGGGNGGGGGGGTAAIYEQCGGIDNSDNGPWKGPTACASGSTCQEQNQYYSQCVPSAKKRDSIPFTHPLLSRREAVLLKDSKPFFLSGDS